MMQEVPSAAVVVRNPTHYAVALKYDRKTAYRAVSYTHLDVYKRQDDGSFFDGSVGISGYGY